MTKKNGKNTFVDDTQWQRSNSANVAKTQLKINIYDFQIILMINFDSRKNYLFKPFTCKTNASNIILRENICVWQPLTCSFTHREELIDSKSQGNRKGISLPLLKRLICFARTLNAHKHPNRTCFRFKYFSFQSLFAVRFECNVFTMQCLVDVVATRTKKNSAWLSKWYLNQSQFRMWPSQKMTRCIGWNELDSNRRWRRFVRHVHRVQGAFKESR